MSPQVCIWLEHSQSNRFGYGGEPLKEVKMSQLRILICRVDNNDENKMTEIASFDVPEREVSSLQAETGPG
jgi:hypothetical protein